MRFSDLLRISIKNMKGKWTVLVAFSMAISAFCLCYAGTVFMTVRQEKSVPFELVVSSETTTGVTGIMLAAISKIADVEDVTPVLQIPAGMVVGEYSTKLTLTGINPSYLGSQSVLPEILPENSVMPYIVLNESACKLFSKDDETTDVPATEVSEIDWLNTKAAISIGEESVPVTSKVCGILESEKNDEPVAYVSLSAAKSLSKASGQTAVYTTAYVRIKNIGCAESINRALDALQLTAANADAELQDRWDSDTKEMTYLIILGAFGLLCSVVLFSAWRRISVDEQQNAYAMLHWLGMKKKDITKMFVLQSTMLSLIGVNIGILIAIVLPSFLSQDLKGSSIFMLPMPIIVVFSSMFLCIFVNVSFWISKYEWSIFKLKSTF
ncbi:hypothetical protein FACS18947_0840 [Bacteroidia bacterium]|nr:hypothetical protein FACS18947_0840 [Bacteroidia bacterium]